MAIVKVIDFGFIDTNAFYSGVLPWEANTEYLQETEFIQDKDVLNIDIFDVAAPTKKSGIPLHVPSNIFYLQNRFFIYQQKLPKLANTALDSVTFFLVTSKSNIPHLNLDGEDPLGFQQEVV